MATEPEEFAFAARHAIDNPGHYVVVSVPADAINNLELFSTCQRCDWWDHAMFSQEDVR